MFELQPPNWPLTILFVVIGLAFVIALKTHLRGQQVWRYDTRAAWLRAFAYFSFAWALAMGSGTIPTILGNPLVLPGQTSSVFWWVFTLLCCAVVFVGYWIIWPIGTLPHGRRVIVPDTVLFGIAWGVSEGLLMGSVWVLAKRFWQATLGAGTVADFAIVFTTIIVLSAFVGLWHALYWDVHISPEHNIYEWNIKKVMFAHNPNLILTSIYVTAWENLGIFVLLQALALFASTLAMPFPSPRWPHPVDPTGPALGPQTDEPADLSGKTAVITGGANGMGRMAAERLATQGARIIIADIDAEGARRAVDEITGRTGSRVDAIIVDLGDPQQVRRAAAEIAQLAHGIDLLLNNAGIFTSRYSTNPEGIESTLAVNHVGPFLLTQLLLPNLQKAQGRIVFVSSDAHFQATAIDWGDLNGESLWKGKEVQPNAGFAQYNRSKLLVTSAAIELAERTAGSGVTVNILTPGALIPTAIYDDLTGPPAFFIRTFKPILRSKEKAMITYLYVCASPEVDGVTGWYFKDGRPTGSAIVANDPENRQRIWDWSLQAAGLAPATRSS
jgi:retinol dehydrogenase-14